MALSGSVSQYYGLSRYPYNYPFTPSDPADATFSLTFNWNVINQDVGYSKSTVAWTLTATALNFDLLYTDAWDKENTTCDHIVFGTDDKRYGAGIREEEPYLDEDGFTTWDDVTIYVDSNTIYKNKTLSATLYRGEQNKILDSGEFVLSHDSDGVFGSKRYSFTLRLKNYYDDNGNPGWKINDDLDMGHDQVVYLYDGIMDIDSITRRAVIDKAPLDFTDEDSPAISYIIPEGMTGYIYLSMDGTGTEDTSLQAVTGTGTYNYVFSEDDLKKIWAIQDKGLKKTRVKFYIKSTTLDNTTFREASEWLNVEVINFNPEFEDPEVYDTNQDVIDRLTGNKYILVKYVSNASFDTTAKGNKGATIASQSVKNGDVTLPGPTGTFEKVISNEFHFTATDNYGRTVQETMQLSKMVSFIDYVKLTSNVQITEMTAEGVATVRVYGKFYDGTFGTTKNKRNRLRVNYDVYANGSDIFEHRDLGYADLENEGSSFSVNGTDYEYLFEVRGLDYQSFYNITVRVSDEIAVQGVDAETLMSATPIFDWGRRDFNFNVPVIMQGWEVDRVVEESDDETGYYENAGGVATNGNYTWSFRKWSSGLMECWCKKSISASFPTAWGSGLATTGRIVQTNLIFPRTFKETPVVTATLSSGYAGGILMSTGSSSVPTSEYSTGTLEIARGGSTTTTTYSYTINYMVKGRWK